MDRELSLKLLERAIETCAAEPVHIPGHIQSHAALIAVDSSSQKIRYASENTHEFIGKSCQSLLGESLSDVFDREQKHALTNALRTGAPEGEMIDVGMMTLGGRDLWVTACPSDSNGIFEFVAVDPQDEQTDATTLRNLSYLSAQIRSIETKPEMIEASVRLLRSFTGYDRVMVYQLDPEGHGTVIAEDAAPDQESFLGLRFPGSDIPEQVRRIMLKTPLRVISDVNGPKVPVRKAHEDLADLDMSAAQARGVSDVHMQYLRNMGHLSSFSLNLVTEGRLWGHIAFMHNGPRKPTRSQLHVCTHLLTVIASKISNLELKEQLTFLQGSSEIRKKVTKSIETLSPTETFGVKLLEEVSGAVGADGAAIILNETLITTGETPPDGDIYRLLDSELWDNDIFASTCIEEDNPVLANLCGHEFPGLLVVPSTDGSSLAFFRKPKSQIVKWAGPPEKNLEVIDGIARLHPRSSFALHETTTKVASLPWDPGTLQLADDLWLLMVSAERNDLIRRTNRQQQLLINELNHRVRNILALIRSLSRETLLHNGSITSYVRALEARIAAVAAAHDLGAENRDGGATLMEIIDTEAAPFNKESPRIKVKGTDMGVRSDIAPLFALIIHELMTNATKYGATSNADGEVTVELRPVEHGLEINWREVGGPPVPKTRRKGFGTALIESSVPFEMSGTVAMNYKREGLQVDIFLPAPILTEIDPDQEERDQDKYKSLFTSPLDVSHLDFAKGYCLLVEDNFVVSLDTVSVMKQVGFGVIETASSVAEANSKLAGPKEPNFVVLDVNLGQGTTSASIARELRSRNTPFIFITGYGEAAPLGDEFNDIPMLKKPVRDEDIARVLLEMA